MSFAIAKLIRVLALVSLFTLLASSPALAEQAFFTFSGEITQVFEIPPPPFEQVDIGDTWTLTYTYDPNDGIDVDGRDTAAQVRNIVTSMSLTIAGTTVSGVPGPAVPSEPYDSVVFLNMNPGSSDYAVQAGLPDASAWTQISFSDAGGTPFDSDALPAMIPTPYDVVFPEYQTFNLRSGSNVHFLRGQIGQVGFEAGTHSQVRVDLEVGEGQQGNPTVSLITREDLFGDQNVGLGKFGCPGCEVMGVEPSPFVWYGVGDNGSPNEGDAIVTFNLDNPGGEVMGVEPSPFRLLIDFGGQGFGEMDFSQVTGYYPGRLGSLYLEGVLVHLPDGTVVALEGFDIYDAADRVSLNGTRIVRNLIDAPDVVGIKVDETSFGVGGLASGVISSPGCEVMGVEPSPFRLVARDPSGGNPDHGTTPLTFNLDPVGEISGVGPSPFSVMLTADDAIVGELDFNVVAGHFPGTLGSLHLQDVSLVLPDGSSLGVEYFDIFDRNDHFTLSNARTDLNIIETSDYTQVDLIVNSERYGLGGFGAGDITNPGSEVMGVEPSPFRWVVDPPPQTDPPSDYEAAVSYISPPGAERMGVEPSPFRYHIVGEGDVILGEVDFSQSEGVWGSFYLEGVRVELTDGSAIEVQSFQPFDVVDVEIDVRPGCERNIVRLRSRGVLPVAILSSSEFDATTVDPETVRLVGASVKLVGNGRRYLTKVRDVNGDGMDDLVCKVLINELDVEVGDSVAVLEAVTFDGTAITGQDSIRVVAH
ncbi:MAG: hypothetical protein GY854_17455 [Deltaproteobacteria bacterium]|nr:hypothetical protein [Deltaproteobacteria bacterium]